MMLSCSLAVVRNTEEIGAVGHFEITIDRVVVADEAQVVRSDGHGGVLADLAWAVQGGECNSRTHKTGIACSDTEGQSEVQEKPDPQDKTSVS